MPRPGGAGRDLCPPPSSPPHLCPFAGCEQGWLPRRLPPLGRLCFFSPCILLLCNRGGQGWPPLLLLGVSAPPTNTPAPTGAHEVAVGPQGIAALGGLGDPREPRSALSRPWLHPSAGPGRPWQRRDVRVASPGLPEDALRQVKPSARCFPSLRSALAAPRDGTQPLPLRRAPAKPQTEP